MERFKKNAFLKCISLIVIFSFLVLDISWAYPPGSPKTHTLAVQPMFQHQMMNAAGERYQGSLFSQIELRA